MSAEELREKMQDLQERIEHLKGFLDVEEKRKKLANLEQKMGEPTFWDDRETSQEIISNISTLKNTLYPFNHVIGKLDDFMVMLELMDEDPGMEEEALPLSFEIENDLAELEMMSFLSGKLDHFNAIFMIKAGAGGTESCDWASMLLRMYTHWFQNRKWKTEIIDMQPGDEAGIKSATILVQGENAYGFCKCEKGVHRLVRISPFDANKKRHTSFAAVDVIADIDESIEVEINEADLKVDTFRASGAGGQHVNRTDSAIRITHIPSGIVVSSQSERSQHRNRAYCMQVIKARLFEMEEQKRQQEMAEEYGEKGDNSWGNQIRSYVLQPYQMVKDLRTGVETSNVSAVLDGEINLFIEAYLRGIRRER